MLLRSHCLGTVCWETKKVAIVSLTLYLSPPACPVFALSTSCHLLISAGLGIATEIPPDGYRTGAVCSLIWQLAVPWLATAFAPSTVSTRGKYARRFYWRLQSSVGDGYPRYQDYIGFSTICKLLIGLFSSLQNLHSLAGSFKKLELSLIKRESYNKIITPEVHLSRKKYTSKNSFSSVIRAVRKFETKVSIQLSIYHLKSSSKKRKTDKENTPKSD